jgi:hypothetical protein
MLAGNGRGRFAPAVKAALAFRSGGNGGAHCVRAVRAAQASPAAETAGSLRSPVKAGLAPLTRYRPPSLPLRR